MPDQLAVCWLQYPLPPPTPISLIRGRVIKKIIKLRFLHNPDLKGNLLKEGFELTRFNMKKFDCTLGVRRKYWELNFLHTVCTTSSNTFLSLIWSIPYKAQKNHHHLRMCQSLLVCLCFRGIITVVISTYTNMREWVCTGGIYVLLLWLQLFLTRLGKRACTSHWGLNSDEIFNKLLLNVKWNITAR